MPTDTPASSTITEHAFTAELWWDSCAICGLGMAAHRHATGLVIGDRDRDLKELPYRCPECVWASEFNRAGPHKGECPHGETTS
jgi:hypothetical protein